MWRRSIISTKMSDKSPRAKNQANVGPSRPAKHAHYIGEIRTDNSRKMGKTLFETPDILKTWNTCKRFHVFRDLSRRGAARLARQAHNLEVTGSNPVAAISYDLRRSPGNTASSASFPGDFRLSDFFVFVQFESRNRPSRIRACRRGKSLAIAVEPITDLLPQALAALIAQSESEGWRFVRRLADEWAAGINRFDRPGETLFAAQVEESFVGVCGLNVDPYAGHQTTGRIRRLYVLPEYRGQGVGSRLLQVVLAAADGRFQQLRVRTENPEAGRLYEGFGFHSVVGASDCTHSLDLVSFGTLLSEGCS
jgi:GNAT superfamily N-acetyltransferase